ncbi:hypothetical protein LTS18_010892, partial [Coniosporium uncinatum]
MSETQQRATATTASRRRTARYAFDDDDGPPTKRARKEDLKEEVDVGVGENGAKIAEKGRVEKGQRQQQGQQQQQVKTRGNAKGKRSKAAYDEDDDGFKFSRTRTKKTKAEAAAPAPAPVPVPASKPAPAATWRRTRNSLSAAPPTDDEAIQAPKRRSARLSGENVENGSNGQVTPVTTKAKRTKKADPKLFDDHDERVDLANSSSALNVEKKRSPKKIALPFADTPVLRRNKEMRKNSGQGGQRRSSSGLRGRRASSLIDSGASNGTDYIAFNTASSKPPAKIYGKHRSIMVSEETDAG